MHRHAHRGRVPHFVSRTGCAVARGDPIRPAISTLAAAVSSAIRSNCRNRTGPVIELASYVFVTLEVLAALSMSQALGSTVLNPLRPAGRTGDADGTGDKSRGEWLLWSPERADRASGMPVHRSIFAIDVEQSTLRTNPDKEEMREQIYRLLEKALDIAGIADRHRDPFTDRGDGILVLVHPADEVPKPLLLSRLIPALSDLVCQYNGSIPAAARSRQLRLRAVIHAGEVHTDPNGSFGEDLDVAFRLLESPRFKAYNRRGIGPLGVVVSEGIYWSVVYHGYDGIDGREFLPLVNVNVAHRRRRGWVYAPAA